MPIRMLKQSASVIGRLRLRLRLRKKESDLCNLNLDLSLFARCGLAWDKARLGAPGLGG